MTTHLPECRASYSSDPPAWCICDELRACEERVIPEAVQRVEALAWQHQGLESTFPLRRVVEAIKAGARTEIKMGMNVYRELWESEPENVVDGFQCSIMHQYPDAEITDISVAYEDADWSHAPRKVGLIATVKIKSAP